MTDIPLAKPYAKENYAKALKNLVKRYDREGGSVHYSDAAFDEVSEDQAQSALKFFGEIGLIEIDKQAHYTPPESVVTWQMSMEGPAKQAAKSKVLEALSNYEVYDEITFLLSDGGRELESLGRDVGGKIGISEDDYPMLERSIEVLEACGFLDINDENIVTLPDEDLPEVAEEEPPEPDADEDSEEPEEDASPDEPDDFQRQTASGIELSISIDVTELSDSELRTKLETIRDVLDDGE